MNITDVAIELNAARLTLRNSNVLLRDSTDSSLGSSSSSTLPYVPIVVKHIQLENLIRNQFRRWSSCFKLHKRLIVLRRGSPLIIIAPFRNFVKISMQLALQPFMIRTNKHDCLKSFSINMHWIMSNQITMNTVYNYDFVVTLEDDVSSPSSIELHTYTVLVLTFISVVVVLFCWSPVSLATVPFPFLTPTPTTVDRWNIIVISICTTVQWASLPPCTLLILCHLFQ